MIFRMLNNGQLKISTRVLKTFSQFRQDKSTKKEGGGLLLGRHVKNSIDIIIDKTTVPYHQDTRSRYFFHKKDIQHQKIIDQEWKESEGTCNYLGEWHTHPEKIPSPSKVDTGGWRRKLLKDSFDHHSLYFIIVGIEEIKAWEACEKDNSIIELEKLV